MARNEARAITIRDVARHAGVSRMTVSRVINGEDSVKPATRSIVEQSIGALNYSPNPFARALKNTEHTVVALLHRFPSPHHLGAFVIGLVEEARLQTSFKLKHLDEGADITMLIQELIADGIQAVLLTPPNADDKELLQSLRAAGLAIVATGATASRAELPWVGIDDQAAARALSDHLLSLGHRRIGFVVGHHGHASSAMRLSGFSEALEARGIAFDPDLVVRGDYTYRSGLEAAERLLSLGERPTAIFASNDDMAAATVAVAHRHGIDVPSELSVCGFDDTPLATTIWPELTTIRQPTRELARVAVELLRRECGPAGKGGSDIPDVVLDYTLVRRASDGPPASSTQAEPVRFRVAQQS